MAAIPSIEADVVPAANVPEASQKHTSALTPPTSEDMDKREDASSELSELDMEENKDEFDEEDIGEVEPDHYYGDGKIPVFKPTMDQFRSFSKFVEKVDKYGMKSGIIKVIPPQEWRDSLPALNESVKAIKVKNPITQEFVGTHGTYTQQNIEKQRSYNLPQWKALTEETNHQPPAKRGERRRLVEPAKPKPRSAPAPPLPPGQKRKPGRPRKHPLPKKEEPAAEEEAADIPTKEPQVPPTPTSPEVASVDAGPAVKQEGETEADQRQSKSKSKPGRPRKSSPKPKTRQPKATTVAERRKYNASSAADDIDEEAFKDFNYRFPEASDFTSERCQELEDVYWKTLNYGTPMYGADMPGSLFDDTCTSWHVGRLENLLDVLGTKVPGVNTTYLYLGMWKATFAWHLEDVDLYSINYIHFGAPKQWYSISQEDARRFEAAMKTIWPMDAKNCDQFLRHKTYLISPEKLKSQFNIKVNKLVHNEGEFVITYPYGYHSGFNLGYNCAESVNFATESWLNYGRIAKKCNCEADSVWVDVAEIERKLRGEPTPEYYEETDDEDDSELAHLPSPPASGPGKRGRPPGGKRKRDSKVQAGPKKTKKIRILVKAPSKMPCILCPNEASYDKLMPTDNGQKVHRLCAMYTPETYIAEHEGREIVRNVAGIDKSRLDLKCIYCRSKRGACFQCSEKKCTRAYHATCAIGAGVQIDTGPVPTWDEEGTEFWCEGFDFRCRFHRPKRAKNITIEALEANKAVRNLARGLKTNDTVQAQYIGGDAFGGVVLENRPEEQSVLVQVLPDGDIVEIEYKWILVLDPADSKRPKPSPDAKKLPETLLHDSAVNTDNRKDGVPELGQPFHDPNSVHKWDGWHAAHRREVQNPLQRPVDLGQHEKLWYYLGSTSTEAKAQYTHDPAIKVHNVNSVFLDTVKPPSKPAVTPDRRSYSATYPTGANTKALNATMAVQRQQQHPQPIQQAPMQIRMDKSYEYKPKIPMSSILNPRPSNGPTSIHSATDGQRTSASPMPIQPAPPKAPPAYQQPPSAQTIAKDPLRAGYPYQNATYTQIHGPQGPVSDPRLAQLAAKSRGASPNDSGRQSPSNTQRSTSHQGAPTVAGAATGSTSSLASGGINAPSIDQAHPNSLPVPHFMRPAPTAPMMGGPRTDVYASNTYVHPPNGATDGASKPPATYQTSQQFHRQVDSSAPSAQAEQHGQMKQFDHLRQLLGDYRNPFGHPTPNGSGQSKGAYMFPPPVQTPPAERIQPTTPGAKTNGYAAGYQSDAPQVRPLSPRGPAYSPLSDSGAGS